MLKTAYVYAKNPHCFALGEQRPNGFYVRRVVWARATANAEKRPGEQIKPALILVPPTEESGKPWTER